MVVWVYSTIYSYSTKKTRTLSSNGISYAEGQRAETTVRPEQLTPPSSTAFGKIFHSNLGSACKLSKWKSPNSELLNARGVRAVGPKMLSVSKPLAASPTLGHSRTSAQT